MQKEKDSRLIGIYNAYLSVISPFAYDEYFRRFSKINRNVDLSFVDNGKYLHELNRLHIEAVNNKTFAQKKELTTENIEDVFDDYEKAYNSYASIYNLIQSSAKSIDFVKHKAVIKDRLNITFGIVGVVSLILTIIFQFI